MNAEGCSSRDAQFTDVESADEDATDTQEEERVSIGDENLTATNGVVENFTELTEEDILGREFATLEDAEKWYTMYATAMGFGTRLQWMGKGFGRISRRRIVCNKEGKREAKWLQKKDRARSAKRETRCNCLAACSIHFNKDTGVFVITEFKTEHSHDLAMQREVHFIRSNRRVTNADLAHIGAMRTCSISTSRAYDYLVNNSGGFQFVGYTSKDMFNKVEAERRAKLIKGEAQNVIDYMNEKATDDPGFMCKFGVDEEGRLANIFWRDSTSLYDFTCFGDVLVFDSTYKNNVYNRPLVVFVGTNNHRATTVFGCAIIVDETVETYIWVLRTFLEAMKGKKPISVLTDGDEAMRKAIVEVFPDSKHRLCSWHVGKNMVEKIKDDDIRKEFRRCMYSSLSTTEWEVAWQNMVQRIQEGNVSESLAEWLEMMFRKKERWAEAFFTGHFFAGMTSTQRCEGMNKHLKFGIGRCSKIYEILPRIARTLRRMRNDVMKDDFNCRNSSPVLVTHMRSLELKLAQKLTHDMYLVAREQIKREKKYLVVNRVPFTESLMFYVTQYKRPERKWTVEVNMSKSDPQFMCSCKLFQSDGIPCAHMFCVMKTEHMETLPDSMIHTRWTKTAREKFIDKAPLENGSNKSMQINRCAALHSLANSICYDGSLTGEGFRLVQLELAKLKVTAERFRTEHDATRLETGSPRQNPGREYHPNVVKDPVIHKSKKARHDEENTTTGETRTEKHCTFCKGGGHNSRTCPVKAAADKAAANTAAANNAATYMAAAYMAAASQSGIALPRFQGPSQHTQTQVNSNSQSIPHHMHQMQSQSQSTTGNSRYDPLRNNGSSQSVYGLGSTSQSSQH